MQAAIAHTRATVTEQKMNGKIRRFSPSASPQDLTGEQFMTSFSGLLPRSFKHIARLEITEARYHGHLLEMMIPAYLYARVSSREQEQEGLIPAQLKILHEYAARNG
jgi:hypothetical protein